LSQDDKKSYGQILKSSVTIGGSSVLNLGLSMVRNKIFALLLGQGGMGLVGVFTSLLELSRSVATMGMNTSGVRQIAEASAAANSERIARTVITLRRLALLLGIVGGIGLVACSPWLGRLTFPEVKGHRAGEVALLGLAVVLWAVSVGQIALVQGMRRIGDLAQASVLGGLLGTMFSIPIIYFWRERGIVPSLICVAAMSLVASWWFSRKVQVERITLSFANWRAESTGLLKLGVVFMLSGLMTLGAAYLVRVMVLRKLGADAAGNYHAAWAVGGMYVGFILQAMGADFLPRLTAVAKNSRDCTRLVNEQTEVSLLLAGPGIAATLALAPVVVWLLYSAEFQAAIEVLRWVCLGMMLRVVSWRPTPVFRHRTGNQYRLDRSDLAGVALVWFEWHRDGVLWNVRGLLADDLSGDAQTGGFPLVGGKSQYRAHLADGFGGGVCAAILAAGINSHGAGHVGRAGGRVLFVAPHLQSVAAGAIAQGGGEDGATVANASGDGVRCLGRQRRRGRQTEHALRFHLSEFRHHGRH
jgi:O-antigen/teichoic acid export membrane protein